MSPDVTSSLSQTYPGFGFFVVTVGVDYERIAASLGAIHSAMAELRDAPVSADILQRAREPALERYDNALKTNGGWIGLVERAQTKPERIERFTAYRKRAEAITPADIQAAARRWLPAGGAVEIVAIPTGATEPALPGATGRP